MFHRSSPRSARNIKRRAIAIPVAIAVFAACTLGAYAATRTDDLSDTAARYVPANALAFATIALDPSPMQKAKLLALSGHFPEKYKADAATAEGTKMINDAVGDELSFETDIKPWLGNEAAAALLPPVDGSTDPMPVAIINVKDQALAKATLDANTVDATSYRFVGDYLVITTFDFVQTPAGVAALDAIQGLIENGGESLNDNKRYKASLSTLGNEHLALAWFDLPEIVKVTKALEPEKDFGFTMFVGLPSYVELKKQIDATGAIAMQAYATTNSIVVRMTTEKVAPETVTSDATLLKALPSNTFAAAHMANLEPNAPGGVVEQMTTYPSGYDALTTELENEALPVPPPSVMTEVDRSAAENDPFALPGSEFAPGEPNPSMPKAGEPLPIDDEMQHIIDLLKTIKGEAVAGIGLADVDDFAKLPMGAVVTTADPEATAAALRAISADVTKENIKVSNVSIGDVSAIEFQPTETVTTTMPADLVTPAEYSLVDLDNPTATAPRTVVQDAGPPVYVGIVDDKVYVSNDTDYFAKLVNNDEPGIGGTPPFAEAIGDVAAQPLLGAFYVDFVSLVEQGKKIDAAGGQGLELSDEEAAWADSMRVGGVKTWVKDDKHVVLEATVVFK